MAEQIRMPSGMGGIVRYDSESKVKIKPAIIIVFIVLVVIFEILLKIFWKTA